MPCRIGGATAVAHGGFPQDRAASVPHGFSDTVFINYCLLIA
ncbi:hypothetical protein [Moorena sp. SIO3H5]|nr:hypothetical protein [Moorena sp. SIO3H5]